MRKSLKFLIFGLIVLMLASVFVINVLAEESEEPEKKQFSLVYYKNDDPCGDVNHDHNGIKYYEEGSTVTVSKTLCSGAIGGGETFFGWFSDDGVLYEKGSTFVITRNTILYAAVGKEVGTEQQFRDYVEKTSTGDYWNYAKLTANLTLSSGFSAYDNSNKSSIALIDLNGFNITCNAKHNAVGCQRKGLILLGSGNFKFIASEPQHGGFVNISGHGYGDGAQRLWIGKNVKIDTNVPLIRITGNPTYPGTLMTNHIGLPTIRIHGGVSVPYLFRSYHAQDVDINLYETSSLTIKPGSDHPLMWDETGLYGYTIVRLLIHGGTISLPEDFKGFAPTADGTSSGEIDDRYAYKINGGTFDRDISTLIPISLRVQNNGDGTYSILPNPCSKAPEGSDGLHRYVAISVGANCTNAGLIKYKCIYCTDAQCDGAGGVCFCEYEIKREAFGHSFISVLVSDMVNTKKETKPAELSKTCSRCGAVEKEYEFPDADDVYISLKVRYTLTNSSGKEIVYNDTIRVKSTDVFGFKKDSPNYGDDYTYINSFSVTSLKYTNAEGIDVKLKQSNIIGIEIPLGTTTIEPNLFKGDTIIEEIYLREGLKCVKESAFANMSALKKITGIEFIEDEIGANAFSQQASDTPICLDTLEVNAKDVGNNAFRNLLATRVIIGDNVVRLRNAFSLDGSVTNYEKTNDIMREVFVNKLKRAYHPVEHPEMYGVPIANIDATVWEALFEEFSATSALLTRGTLYFDHKKEQTRHEPTCKENGKITTECVYCGLGEVVEILSNEGYTHIFEDAEPVKATCSQVGQIRQQCTRCKDYKVISEIPIDPSKHDFSTTEPEPTPGACESTEWEYRRRCAYGCGTWSPNKYSAGDKIVLGHIFSDSPDDIVVVPPTCGNPGQSIQTCTRCLKQEITETEAIGTHSWVRDDTLKVAPTCGAVGTNHFRCSVCSATDTEEIPQLTYEEAVEKGAHKWTEKVIVEPTTKKIGYKRVYCELCNANKQGATLVINKLEAEKMLGMPKWLAITLICVLSAGAVAAIVAVVCITVFKKKNKSTGYKYKFNTFKK
ncbi:MAG: leucine-rich repeat protein [Clostridia bacterium]|nr:leucine-rich repeat protein [Clostridia bacterium]